MNEKIQEATDPAIRNILLKLLALYGLWTIEKHHLVTLYQGGFATGSKPATMMQDAILKLSKDVKDDSVALIDVLAPPDFVINSVLGKSDGLVSNLILLLII